MNYVAPGQSFEQVFDIGITGLVGTIAGRVDDGQGHTVIGPLTSNFVESGVSGTYTWTLFAPAVDGQYSVLASSDGSFDVGTTAVDDLNVNEAWATGGPGLPSIPGGGVFLGGPCSLWTTTDEVAACCSSSIGSDTTILESSLQAASELLYELTGRRFAGTCSSVVRPCRPTCACNWTQILSRGHIVWNDWSAGYGYGFGSWYCDDIPCGCTSLSRIKLAGYPVREISQVKINGALVDPSDYRLDDFRWLTRLNGDRWPGCSRLDLDDSEEGTFSVSYSYGQDPPLIGQKAAGQLACEIYKACVGDECQLPEGVTRVIRQGIVIEKLASSVWAFQMGNRAIPRGWHTGLSLVDAFLNAFNPAGKRRRSTVWSPDAIPYARPVGT